MDRIEEFQAKRQRLLGLLDRHQLAAVVLTRRSNFAWLTCGGQNYVGTATEMGVGSLVITHDQVCLLSSNIENARLLEEECRDLPLKPTVLEWPTEGAGREKALQQFRLNGPVGADSGIADIDLSRELMLQRRPLLSGEIARYRSLGRDAGSVMNRAALALRPGMSELAAASLLVGAALEMGIEATVRLVAFDERIDRYRHPIPTSKTLSRRALLVLGARRHGLITSLSRMVSFGKVSNELRHKQEAVCRVDTVLNLASTPGTPLSEVLQQGIEQYALEGFSDEWHHHHQGGLTGYEGRDVRATPDALDLIQAPDAVAWNPSITGVKSEDTFLVRDKGVENLTLSEDWPQITSSTSLGTLARPDILER